MGVIRDAAPRNTDNFDTLMRSPQAVCLVKFRFPYSRETSDFCVSAGGLQQGALQITIVSSRKCWKKNDQDSKKPRRHDLPSAIDVKELSILYETAPRRERTNLKTPLRRRAKRYAGNILGYIDE
jgi:hypothetical protein